MLDGAVATLTLKLADDDVVADLTRYAEEAGSSVEAYLAAEVERSTGANRKFAAYLKARADRGKDVDIRSILAKSPDVPPVPGDELPDGFVRD